MTKGEYFIVLYRRTRGKMQPRDREIREIPFACSFDDTNEDRRSCK